MTRIILIRHGETLWDIEKRAIGHLDVPLSELGKKQSIAIAERLKNIPFTHLYSSDLGRAVETAEYIAKICNVDIKIDVDLREININKFNACTQLNLNRNTSTAAYENKIKQPLDCIIPNSETHRQRQDRIINVMNSLAHIHANETIVIISHSSVLKGFLEFVIGIKSNGANQLSNKNTSYNSFIKETGTWSLETWGELDHLQDL